jgi:uncharacterized protein YhhL (DUF1145 family)
LHDKVLPVQVVGVIFGQILLNLLHHFQEVRERNVLLASLFLLVLSDMEEHLLGFFWISLQTLHDGL